MNNPAQTKSIWQRWSPTTRFSVLAFVGSIVLTFLSLGALGYLIYYPVGWLLPHSIDSLHGDAVWPAVIMAGLVWSLGFLWAGLVLHYLAAFVRLKTLRLLVYVLVIWTWALVIWWSILSLNSEP